MQPEDIDQLFRAKLEQHATPPPPSLWYDLQEQLEPEKKERRGGFFMYAVAAAVTLLLLAGGWLLWQGPRTSSSGTLASNSASDGKAAGATGAEQAAPAPANTPAATDFATESAANTNSVAAGVAATDDAAKTLKNSVERQATAAPRPASTPQQQQLLARTERAAAPRESARPEAPVFRASPAPVVAERQTVAVQPVPAAAPAPQAAGFAPTAPAVTPALPAGAIEVEVRQHPDQVVALAAPEADETPGRTRPSVRGVLRQVRRLAQGEKPDLTEVGLPANPALTVQARVAGHTLTKTIAL
jgi:hypothetical protein